MLVGINACSMREIRTTADTSCLSFGVITYAVPNPAKVETAENLYDTGRTVEEIQVHNAKWEAICRR